MIRSAREVNANQKATKNISGYFSTVSVFACKRIFIKNCWLKFCRVQAVRRAWTHRDNKRNSGLFLFWTSCLAGQLLWGSEIGVNHSFEDDCVAVFFFFYYSEREFREEKYKFETKTKVFRQSELNLLWTLCVQRSRESLSNMSSKIYVVVLWINNQLQTLNMTLFAKNKNN